MSAPNPLRVGRVLRASTRGFTIGCAVMQPALPAFGTFVRAAGHAPGSAIYGLIYDVSVEDDLFVRQFIGADAPEEVVLDQRANRQVPIEVSVLAVGSSDAGRLRHSLPPQPPVTLDWLYVCTDEDICAFTTRLDFCRLVLEAREVPADELLAASLGAAAMARPAAQRETFLVDAGRELARLLAADPVRLEWLLRRISPR
jgi:hypothetical protein